ncbi:MAG TPA: AMP-binding protein, partial [Thermoanaerobaculia bacterium]|nr:AMP-binding protein [Thermoanaerobaculia bacterium]
RVREAALGGYAHQDLPFEKLVEELRPERDLRRNPLVQVAFVLQNASMPPLALPELTLTPVDLEVAAAKFDWLLSLWDTEPDIEGSLEFNSELFDPTTVERLLDRYKVLLAAFVAAPETRIRMVPLFAAELAGALGLPPAQVAAVAPLTTTQRDLYLDHELNPESVVYSLGVSARLGMRVDAGLWNRAVATVVAGEPTTRLRVLAHANEPFLVVERGVTTAMPSGVLSQVVELAAAGDAVDAAWDRLIQEKVKVRYHLADGNLFRSYLVRGLPAASGAPASDVALLAFHHLAADAFSGRLLLERIAAAYERLAAGQALELPASPTFLDGIGESLARFDTPEVERFWSARLAGIAPLELHSGVERLSRPASRRLRVNGEELAELAAWCGERLSLAALLRGTFAALLSRVFSPAGDLLLHDVVSGRPREHARTVGCFYQVVPVVLGREALAPLSPMTPLAEYFAFVRNYRRDLGAHQNLSVSLARRLARGEKLRFFYNYYPFARFELLGSPTTLAVHDSFAEDEVHLIVSDNRTAAGGELELGLYWNERLFSDLALLDRLVAMALAVARGAGRLQDLPVLLPAERQQVLAGWNDTAVDYAEPPNLQLLLERQARRTPAAPAVRCEGEELTYGELHRRANRLAHRLIALGVGPETVVATAVERSLTMVVALVAILKAGGAYLPLDPDYPEERLRLMLADSGASVLLLGRRPVPGLGELGDRGGRVLRLADAADVADVADDLEDAVDVDPECRTTPESLAYVIYTSGSTGRPKGAMNTHGAIANRLLWMQQAFGLTAADAVLQKTPLSFDVSVWEVFWPLLTGARLVLARPEGHKDGAYLVRLIRDEAVTTLHFVPSMLRLFLEEPEVESCRSIRRVIASGEALPAATVARLFARLPAEMHNLYGPTE